MRRCILFLTLLFMERAAVTLAQTTAAAAAAATTTTLGQCQVGEALLEIRNTHTPTEGFIDMNIFVQGPRFRAPTNNDMVESFSYYSTLLHPVTGRSVSLCVPEDQGLTASVGVSASLADNHRDRIRYELSPQDVTFIYNGQMISDIKGPYPYSGDGVQLVAELLRTNCTVVCDPEEEVLLELEAVIGDIASFEWQILDCASRGEFYCGCPASDNWYSDARCYWSAGQYYHERICLPKNGCFALLAGESDRQIYMDDGSTLLNVTLEGKHLKSLDGIHVEVVPLKDDGTIYHLDSHHGSGSRNVLPDETHRYFSCVESSLLVGDGGGSCTEVTVAKSGVENGNIANYSISVNGKAYLRREDCDSTSNWCEAYIWNPIGGDCSKPRALSNGAIVGLAIGGAVLALLCSVAAFREHARRSKRGGGGGQGGQGQGQGQ